MVEIIVTVYITSFLLSMCLVAWNFTAVSRQVRSESLRRVNANLGKIGFFWSMTREDFCRIGEFTIEGDAKSALRSTLMLGLLSLGSAIGFFLLLAITLTMRLLKSNRRGRAVFHSALATNADLSAEQVQALYQEYSQIF
jgi:hypothetical protein